MRSWEFKGEIKLTVTFIGWRDMGLLNHDIILIGQDFPLFLSN